MPDEEQLIVNDQFVVVNLINTIQLILQTMLSNLMMHSYSVLIVVEYNELKIDHCIHSVLDMFHLSFN